MWNWRMIHPFDKQATSGVTPLCGQHNARIGLSGTRSPRVQTSGSVRAEEATLRCLQDRSRRQWKKAVTLMWLLCFLWWETCHYHRGLSFPERNPCQTISSVHSEHFCKSGNPHRHSAIDTSTRKYSNRTQRAEQAIHDPSRSPSWSSTPPHCVDTGPRWHVKRTSRIGLARKFEC